MGGVTVEARLSPWPRRFAVCGACGRSLCRRDRIDGLDITAMDRPHGDIGRLVPPVYSDMDRVHHELRWDEDWHLVGDHIERSASALDRLARGNAPVRRGTVRGQPGPRQSLDFPNYPPALCPWATCGALNRIDPRRLDVLRGP